MRLSIALLTRSGHQTLGTFLLHLDCDVKVYTELTDFLSDAIARPFQLIFLEEKFLTTEQDFQRLRLQISKKNRLQKTRVVFLNPEDKVFKLHNSGFVSSEDLSTVKNIVEESLVLNKAQYNQTQDMIVFDDEAEVVELSDEEVIDERSERMTESLLNI